MMESKILTPGVVGIKVDTKQEGEVACLTMQAMLDLLGTQHRVYVRRKPELSCDKSFESDKVTYMATCRFLIVDGPPGLISPPRTYDNDNMLTTFGLSLESPK